jgi:uncharacterized protein (TIGR02145 family)
MKRKHLMFRTFIIALLVVLFIGCNADEEVSYCDLSGYAFYAGTSIPIASVNISVQSKSAITDIDGFYEIDDIPDGNHTLIASKDGYDNVTSNIKLISGTNNCNVEITSSTYTHKIMGTLTSKSNGLGISNCRVTVLNPDSSVSQLYAYTSSNGFFQVASVPEGSRTIRFSEKCYLETQLNVSDSDLQYDAEFETEFVDIRDGKVYVIVEIGEQVWMAENLNYGEIIEGDLNQEENQIAEKYSFYNDESYCNTYGGLYQWDEAMQYQSGQGSQGVCPDGWHLPTDDEWTTLVDYIGGSDIGGDKLKEISTTYWHNPNTGATNESGFSALPGGHRMENGQFVNLGEYTTFWSSTEYSDHCSWYRQLENGISSVSRGEYEKYIGRSVRCIRN